MLSVILRGETEKRVQKSVIPSPEAPQEASKARSYVLRGGYMQSDQKKRSAHHGKCLPSNALKPRKLAQKLVPIYTKMSHQP